MSKILFISYKVYTSCATEAVTERQRMQELCN